MLLLLVVFLGVQGGLGASHPELRGEEPDQADIDNGQCIPIKCALGVPPIECTRMCALRHYVPTCQTPADFCLCQRLVGDNVELVSPDEVLNQPEPQDVRSFFFRVFLPLKYVIFDPSQQVPQPSPEPFARVNVHEGRLLWDFRYILTGLIMLMIGLIVYEIVLCRMQTNYGRPGFQDRKQVILNI